MFNRCKICRDKCPDYSDICHTCAFIQYSIAEDEWLDTCDRENEDEMEDEDEIRLE